MAKEKKKGFPWFKLYFAVAYIIAIYLAIGATQEELSREFYDRWVATDCPFLDAVNGQYRIVAPTIACEKHESYTSFDQKVSLAFIWIFAALMPVLILVGLAFAFAALTGGFDDGY